MSGLLSMEGKPEERKKPKKKKKAGKPLELEGEALGDYLRFFRKRKKIKSRGMAERLGVSSTHYSNIELGKKNPSLTGFSHILTHMDLSQIETARIYKAFLKAKFPHSYRTLYYIWKLVILIEMGGDRL